MIDKQPEALRLADELNALLESDSLIGASTIDKAAAELRRLHERETELAARLGETIPALEEAAAELDRLHELNAELVDAFKQLMNDIDNGIIEVKTMQNANAALAKAQGDNNDVPLL